jgi:RHS repeat-associated protein
LLCCVGLCCWTSAAEAAEGSPAGEEASPLNATFVAPGSPLESEELQAEQEAKLDSPEAVAEREASQEGFSGLSTARVGEVLTEAFPAVVDNPVGGPPDLPSGQRITGFSSDYAAQVDLGGGAHGAIESLEPMAVEPAPGERAPVDLSLGEVGGGFEPVTPAVDVRIPKQLGDGVQLPGVGVSLIPVDAQGHALEGAGGAIEGATALYANTQTDTDTAVKPITLGFETDSFLRSVESPQELDFRVGLPQGASLVAEEDGSGGVAVVKEGVVLAVIAPPSARDAAGRSVPVSMTMTADDMLALVINHRTGEYTYPIDVDPTVTDSAYQTGVYTGYRDAWLFYNGSGPQFQGAWEINGINHEKDAMRLSSKGSGITAGEWAYYYYITKGASQVYTWHAKTESSGNGTNSDAQMFIWSEKGVEGTASILPRSGTTETTICALSGCAVPGSIESGRGANGGFFEVYAELSGSDFMAYKAAETTVGIVQYAAPTVSFDTADQFIEGYNYNAKGEHVWITGLNPLYGGGRWVSKYTGMMGYEATDPGVGVDRLGWSSSSLPGWGQSSNTYGLVGRCKDGIQCEPCVGAHCSVAEPVTESLWYLPEGEDVIEATSRDGVGLSATGTATVKLDKLAPHNITLPLPAGNEVGDGQSHELKLKATATDGAGTVPSSGVASFELSIDGKSLGSATGSCAPGPCTATGGEWILNTEEYGAGKHTLTVTATDNVGNVGSETFTLTIHHASPVAMGPGSVNPLTGELNLGTTDVSVAGPGAAMTVGRSYSSRHLTAGSEGPLGPLWTMSVGGEQSIVKLANGSVVLTNSSGQQATFTSTGGGKYASPPGDAGLTLTETAGKIKLTTGTSTVTFAHPSGGSESVWMPAITESTGGTNASTFAFQTVEVEGKKITEPTEELAPVPAGVSCSPTLTKGCRALTFNYASTKTATGEGATGWGDYVGRLTRVYFTAWDPVKKEITTSTVAQYAYDLKGRLRAEWNPLIAPALKTDYGYDPEGHLTALTPPGRESWALTYGTTAGDPNLGRLLKVMRPPVSTVLWAGTAPTNTEAPKVTGTAAIGTRLAVSDGAWSNAPLTYGYQWQDCNPEGKECSPIPGATNPNYTPVESDLGHTLIAEVFATNGGGTVIASSAATHRVGPVEEYALTKGVEPWGITAGPDGNLWFANLLASKIGKITTAGAITEYAAGTFPCGIATGSDKNLWFTGCLSTKISKMTTAGVITPYTLPAGAAWGITAGPDERLWYTNYSANKIGKITTAGVITEYALPVGSEPKWITTGPDKNLWFTDSKTSKIGKITTAGVITEYALPAGSSPSGIAAGPDEKVWFTDKGTSKIGKITTAGTITEYSLPAGSAPESITTGSDKNLWFTNNKSNTVGRITTAGVVTEYPLPAGSGPVGITGGPDENLWFTDSSTSTIGKINLHPSAPVEGEQRPPSPGATIEYNVPVSGAGAPYEMSTKEVESWGQKDLPTEATAIFPPDEPQGWPASDYKRASIEYVDSHDRTVNAATPSKGITTAEYNTINDITRTLSPDNRQAALAEGTKSSEVSKLLDSQSTYNSEGTELLSTLGPQHNVQLPNGTQAQAREIKHYYYDEGAPTEGGPYHLVTKTTDAALVAGKEEDIRTTNTSYSGQTGLGWKLRKPTATTTDPAGLNLVHSVQYSPTTGAVTETRQPGSGTPGEEPGYTFGFQFGKEGTTEGRFKEPQGIAVNANGVYVLDTGNSRVQQFDTKGKWIRTFGSLGAAEGQLKTPRGIALDPKGDVWIADTGNNRIEEFSATGTYLAKITESLKEPQDLAVETESKIWVADTGNNRIDQFVHEGTSWLLLTKFGTLGSGETQFSSPQGITLGPENALYVSDNGNNRVDQYKINVIVAEHIRNFASLGSGNGQLKAPRGIAANPEGDVFVADAGNSRIEEFSPSGIYLQTFGKEGTTEGKLKGPVDLALDTTGNAWITDTGNNRISQWTPSQGYEGPGAGTAHNTQTIYYTASANSTYPTCGERPEWSGLPCKVQPTKQPAGPIGNLPVTTTTYDIWEQPETITEVAGSETRTTTASVDAAGRPIGSAISATSGIATPPVTYEYNAATGAPEKTTTIVEGIAQSVTATQNALGDITSYTDASGNTSKYEYEGDTNYKGAGELDGRLRHSDDGKGNRTYSYDPTSGYLSSLADSGAGILTATRDVEGNIIEKGYPNGMSAKLTADSTGEVVNLEYEKTTHCAEKCVWFSDAVTPSIRGAWRSQASTLSNQSYKYDSAQRLIEVQDTPVGKGCTVRLYSYDAETNGTALTARGPGAEGKCATEGGVSEAHTYDEGNRLNDTGVTYEAFGNISHLPASDAGGSELTSTFYSNNRLANQTQNGETISYRLDPASRAREVSSTGKTSSNVILHYAGQGDSPAWTAEEPSGRWTRNIAGIDGSLVAVQMSGESPVLELADLHGDTVATASVTETEAKLLSTSDTTEYGVPRTSAPPRYSWLGAAGRATELPSGIIAMGARSYIPELGRYLQPDPVEGGSANAYSYTFGDPVNTSDPSGESTGTPPEWAIQGGAQVAEEAVARRAAEEAAARAEAERKAAEAAAAEAAYWAYWNSYSWVPPAETIGRTLSGHVGSGGATTAEAAFEHTWKIPGWAAFALGSAITISGSDLGGYLLGLVKIPSWVLQAIDHKLVPGGRTAFAGALMIAGRGAIPGTSVTIHIWGSLKYALYWDVDWEELVER